MRASEGQPSGILAPAPGTDGGVGVSEGFKHVSVILRVDLASNHREIRGSPT